MTNEELLLTAGTGDLQDQAKKIHRACTAPPDVETSQPGNTLNSRGSRRCGRPKWMWQNTFKEDMQEMGASGTHGEARSVTSDCADGESLSTSVPTGTGGPKSSKTSWYSTMSSVSVISQKSVIGESTVQI